MKNILITTLIAGLLSLALISPASAAKGDKKEAKKAAREETKKLLSTYDKNSNNEIDGEEKDALRKAFETDTTLKKLDLNADGKLDDTELAAIKGHQKGEGKKGEKKKKGAKKKKTTV